MEMVIVLKTEIVAVCMNSELVKNLFTGIRNWSLKETSASSIGLFICYVGLYR